MADVEVAAPTTDEGGKPEKHGLSTAARRHARRHRKAHRSHEYAAARDGIGKVSDQQSAAGPFREEQWTPSARPRLGQSVRA